MDQITGALVAIALVLARGVRAHGVLRRLHRRHLPPVLDHAGVGDGPVGAGGADPDARRCAPPSSSRCRPSGHVEHTGFFGWFNRDVRRRAATSTSAGSRAMLRAPGPLDAGVSRHRRRHGRCCSRASRRRSCRPKIPGFAYGQVQTPPGASKERTWAVLDQAQKYLLERGEGRRRRRAHRQRLQLRRARARTPVCSSSSCATGTSARRASCRSARCSAAPTSTSPASRTRTSSRCRRRRCSSSATPRAST